MPGYAVKLTQAAFADLEALPDHTTAVIMRHLRSKVLARDPRAVHPLEPIWAQAEEQDEFIWKPFDGSAVIMFKILEKRHTVAICRILSRPAWPY